MDKKSYGNIFICDISYKRFIGAKPMCILFDKVYGFIRVYDGTKYLVLLFTIELDILFAKKVVSHVFSHNYARIKIDSYDSLFPEKTLTLYNFIILTESVLNKDQNHYYYNILVEFYFFYQLTKKWWEIVFDSIIMSMFGKTKVAKEEFYGAKNQ